MSDIHYSPDGHTTEQHIVHKATDLLGRTRKQGGFEYHFDAILTKCLHRGANVGKLYTHSTRKSGKHDTSDTPSSHEGVIAEHPHNIYLLMPTHRKTAIVRWKKESSSTEVVSYSLLQSPLVQHEESLRKALLDAIVVYKEENDEHTSTTDLCDIQLHNTLLMVQCATERLATELRSVVSAYCETISRVKTYTEDEQNTHTTFIRTPISHQSTGPQVHTLKQSALPSNRKQFTQKVRQDSALQTCRNDNIAKHNGQRLCNQLQPTDFLNNEVIVPHWDTNKVIESYVCARVVENHTDDGLVGVLHANKKKWLVPVQHAHPMDSCQEVLRGSCVFVVEGRDRTGPISTYTISRVLQPNNKLVCGFAKMQPVDIPLPQPFSVQALHKALETAGVKDVRVSSLPLSASIVFTSSRPRFTVWASSSCARLLGFREGCAYETTLDVEQNTNVLISPHVSPLLKTTDTVIHTDVQLEITAHTPKAVSRIVGTHQCVPMRYAYSKDSRTYAHLSAYQNFPIRFLSPQRPQRGLLLFHDMGSGKSRTSIEMAQRDVESRFWSNNTEPFYRSSWHCNKPRVILLSPTQEARDHFIEECGVWLASRWTRLNKTWVPVQHIYSSFETESLQEEIRQQQKAVLQYLMQNVFLPIVYTNNTNSLFDVMKTFRRGCEDKSFSTDDQTMLKQFFHRPSDDRDFRWDSHTLHADDVYARLFSDSFVIIDEIHNLCNSIALASENQRPENSGLGTFFYRALMEAMDCRVVGLTGTPIQRSALSVAPLFNIIRGKLIVCSVNFADDVSKDVCDGVFASFRPFAQTVWADCQQTNNKGFVFTPWHNRHTLTAMRARIKTIHQQYKKSISIFQQDTELFPFAFHYKKHLLHTSKTKTYVYNNTSFVQKYVKNGEICNVAHFLLRISGLVSYISPPKQTQTQQLTHSVASTNESTSNEYPTYDIHTVHIAAHQSHIAYLQAIFAKKKAINQSKADVEQRSGCNVNWNAVPHEVLDGREGLLKLFFKGNQDEQTNWHIEEKYHQLLHKVHQQFADPSKHVCIQPYINVNDKLQLFSPKLHHIVRTLLSQREQKSVVYSDFIDGVGKLGIHRSPSNQPHSSQNTMDEKHVGLSGLGLLGYILKNNGYVHMSLRVHHPLEALHRCIWNKYGNKRDVFMALGPRRCKDTVVVSANELTHICADLQLPMSPEEKDQLRSDVHWSLVSTRVCDLCRRCLLQEEFSPNFMMYRVQYRISLDETCRAQLVSHSSPLVYAEYSNRVVRNTTSKVGLQCAKQVLLQLYNVRSRADLLQLPLTAQASADLATLLNASHTPRGSGVARASTRKKGGKRVHRPSTPKKEKKRSRASRPSTRDVPTTKNRDTGNVHGALIQTLLVSMGVTEGVEFKDVRTMHILEPPADYRKLEQMFGRVIRRGSHTGLTCTERDVNIYLYILSSSNSLDNAKHKALGQQQRRAQLTADEHYWTRVIRRKYEISQEFYHMMKHMAVDCPHNLVLNTASFQDRSLTCFEYPYQKNLQDWVDSEAPLYSPLEDMTDESRNNTHVRAIDLARVEQMVRLNV